MALKNLVIVESPAKAKTIAKYLNGNKNLRHLGKFVVMSSKGHIRDLKLRELSIDVSNDFKTDYEVLKDKVQLVKELKEKASQVTNVYLAADFDREGEAISQHLKETLGLKSYHRITFTEITSKALENAILKPRKIDDNLVDAQETRRVLDRLVGFKISPLLWKKYNANKIHLSAGRVQSAVLHLIREKEQEVKTFETHPYWYFRGDFDLTIGNEAHKLEDVKLYDNDRVYKIDNDVTKAREYLGQIKNKFTITDLKKRQLKQNADLPFITSTLQQEAYSKHGFPIKRTMALAQDLYEKGFITYMRTDSYNISEDFKQQAEQFIVQTYGTDYYEGTNQRKPKQTKNAQEAHEAIRPTSVAMVKLEEQGLNIDHKKMYDLIWKRTVAYFMKAAVYEELEINIHDEGLPKTAYFLASFKKVKFNGFMTLYGVQSEEYDFSKYIDTFKQKNYTLKCLDIEAHNTFTSPPARYNEATIIKTLEAESIGRPSTFTTILTKLFEKHYVLKSDVRGVDKNALHLLLTPNTSNSSRLTITEKKEVVTIGHERSKLVPSDIGMTIDDFMETNFHYIIDKGFTSSMEEDLDKIANGEITRSIVLSNFWKTFGEDVKKIEDVKKVEKIKVQNEQLSYTINGKEYIVRLTKYGPAIQYNNGTQDKYIDIKNYLKYLGKSYVNTTEDDIKFMISLPKKFYKIDNVDLILTSGPYGLYFKYNDENVKIPLKFIKKMLDPELSQTITPAELSAVLQAHKNKKQAKVVKKEDKANAKANASASNSKPKPKPKKVSQKEKL
jgi:DNA topoisomerase-1